MYHMTIDSIKSDKMLSISIQVFYYQSLISELEKMLIN